MVATVTTEHGSAPGLEAIVVVSLPLFRPVLVL